MYTLCCRCAFPVTLLGLLLVGSGCRKGVSATSRTAATAATGAASVERPVPGFGAPQNVLRPDTSASNTDCLVCHPGLVNELIAVKHLELGMGCRHCHGLSDHHMQDEMQMTPPDFLYGRNEVEPFCKTCHARHQHPERVEAFFKKWRGKDRPNGRVVAENSTCTDCHGTHNLHRGKTDEQAGQTEWIALFDGSSLKGWKPAGKASWKIEKSAIVARPGPDGVGGELLSTAKYRNFRLAVTYRVQWPAEAGIWFRRQSSEKALRVCILESADPPRYTGSLKGATGDFIAINTSKELVSLDGWNTLAIRAEDGQIQVWLNGTPIAVATDPAPDAGKIGFHIAAGNKTATMKLTIREVLLQPIE